MIQCIFCVKEVYNLSTLKEDTYKAYFSSNFYISYFNIIKKKVLVNILQREEKHLQKNTVRILRLCLLYQCVLTTSNLIIIIYRVTFHKNIVQTIPMKFHHSKNCASRSNETSSQRDKNYADRSLSNESLSQQGNSHNMI